MSANLPEVGHEVVATGHFGRTEGERHVVRSIDQHFVWTRKNLRHLGGNEPTTREHFWLVFSYPKCTACAGPSKVGHATCEECVASGKQA